MDNDQGKPYAKLEEITAEQGYQEIYLAVDPLNTSRAYPLYQRLGYHPLQKDPYLEHWEFEDSDGIRHAGDDWIIDMLKKS